MEKTIEIVTLMVVYYGSAINVPNVNQHLHTKALQQQKLRSRYYSRLRHSLVLSISK